MIHVRADHAISRASRKGRLSVPLVFATAAAAVLAMTPGATAVSTDTGFDKPYAGSARYERFAPVQATTSRQINRALGPKAADRIARKIGLDKKHVFTPRQYRLFVTGRGIGGERAPAKLVDASVRILTNTKGRPLYSDVDGTRTASVLASYGVMVNTDGMLQSPANSDAPTRQVNSVIEPGGYLGKWCRKNGARKSLRMLYRSAYTAEAVYGNKSQQLSGAAQLVTNTKGSTTTTVGMSMVPSIWIVNFALIYTLKPAQAAKMPARWTPIPAEVAAAIEASPSGQVPYSEYMALFPN